MIATKVGEAPGREGLSPANIAAAADASLARLGTDQIDLYYAHEDNPGTPLRGDDGGVPGAGNGDVARALTPAGRVAARMLAERASPPYW